MTLSRNNRRALFGAAVLVSVAALVKCSGPEAGAPAPSLPLPDAVAIATATQAAIPAVAKEAAATKPNAKPPAAKAKAKAKVTAKAKKVAVAKPKRKTKKKKKLRVDVATKDFVVSGVSVSERGYQAKIDGWVRLTRKGALAQPLLAFDLTDGDGNLIHRGSFTPMDSSGPVWLGFDELGLKRVPFSTTVDLRAEGGVLPAVPPRPYAASVRVAEVIDAKPATR